MTVRITPQVRRLRVAVVVVLLAALLSWLTNGQSSPLHEYFLWHVGVPNTVGYASFPAVLFGVVVSGKAHAPSDLAFVLGFVLQWFTVGYVVGWIFIRSRS